MELCLGCWYVSCLQAFLYLPVLSLLSLDFQRHEAGMPPLSSAD